jgi:hypothetical protein
MAKLIYQVLKVEESQVTVDECIRTHLNLILSLFFVVFFQFFILLCYPLFLSDNLSSWLLRKCHSYAV